jgi:hypothetical protein
VVDLGLDVSPGPPDNDRVRVLDRTTLQCRVGATEPYLLHYWNHPKPWLPNARRHLCMDSYVDLLARVLTSDDVAVRLSPRDLPVWLRDDLVGRTVRRTPRRLRRGIRRGLSLLPESVEQRARDVGGTVATKMRLG